jgi:hypothetical protein
MLSEEDKGLISGQLNPQFVEWMMCYPKDWTLLPDGLTRTRKPRSSSGGSPAAEPASDASGIQSSPKSPTKSSSQSPSC